MEKVQPGEAVGVVVRIDNKIQVIFQHNHIVGVVVRIYNKIQVIFQHNHIVEWL